MRAVRYQDVDGYRIVRSVGEPILDPMKTRKNACKVLESSPEWAEISSLLREASSPGVSSSRVRELVQEAYPAVMALREKYADLLQNNLVYFDTVPSEINYPDPKAAELSRLLQGLGANEQLSINGDLIPDYRGATVWSKGSSCWKQSKITKLGDMPSSNQTLDKDLTPEQRREIEAQEDRRSLLNLTPNQRKSKEAFLKRLALKESFVYRQELEIQGQPEIYAKEKAQEMYQSRIESIEARFRGLENDREGNQTNDVGHAGENGSKDRQTQRVSGPD